MVVIIHKKLQKIGVIFPLVAAVSYMLMLKRSSV